MGNESNLKWDDAPIGKLLDQHIREIKEVEYVVMALSTLKDQTYNDTLLNYARLPYSFLITASEGVDKEDDYIVAYFLRFSEAMFKAYMNSTLILFINASYFRIYQNGECIGAYTKTDPSASSNKG